MNTIENDRLPAKNSAIAPSKWKAFKMHPVKIIIADIIPILEFILFIAVEVECYKYSIN